MSAATTAETITVRYARDFFDDPTNGALAQFGKVEGESQHSIWFQQTYEQVVEVLRASTCWGLDNVWLPALWVNTTAERVISDNGWLFPAEMVASSLWDEKYRLHNDQVLAAR